MDTATFQPKKGNVIFNPKERWIKLSGTITQATASEFARFLVLTHALSSDWRKPIMVLIDSKGGDAVASQLIYYILANSPSPVTTCVEGKAFSGAFTIVQAGYKRLIYKNAILSFHWPVFDFLRDENCNIEELDLIREKIRRLNNHLYRIFRRRSGLPMAKVKQFFREDKVLTAKKAKKYNLVDDIVSKPRFSHPKERKNAKNRKRRHPKNV